MKVSLLCEHHMSHGIRPQLKAFLQGFHELIPPTLIAPFDAQECAHAADLRLTTFFVVKCFATCYQALDKMLSSA